jgi:hypothetical protein
MEIADDWQALRDRDGDAARKRHGSLAAVHRLNEFGRVVSLRNSQ